MKIQFNDRKELLNMADRLHGFLCPKGLFIDDYDCQDSCYYCWVTALESVSGGNENENNI